MRRSNENSRDALIASIQQPANLRTMALFLVQRNTCRVCSDNWFNRYSPSRIWRETSMMNQFSPVNVFLFLFPLPSPSLSRSHGALERRDFAVNATGFPPDFTFLRRYSIQVPREPLVNSRRDSRCLKSARKIVIALIRDCSSVLWSREERKSWSLTGSLLGNRYFR